MLAMTNLMLHGIDVPNNIRHDNTLSRPLKDLPEGPVDIILTNPPFGGPGKTASKQLSAQVSNPRNRRSVHGADHASAPTRHRPRRRRAADSFLFGEGARPRSNANCSKVQPAHHRAPAQGCFCTTPASPPMCCSSKGRTDERYRFFEHPYPDGYKSYSRSKPLEIKEFDLEKAWWGGPSRKGRKTTENAWKVSAADIAARNYNLDCKNPHAVGGEPP